MLALIGPKLKELKLKIVDFYEVVETERSVDVLKIFVLCPNLDRFEFLGFNGSVNMQIPVVFDNLKLKSIILLRVTFPRQKDSCRSF